MKRYWPFLIIGAVVIIAGGVAAYFVFGSDDKNKPDDTLNSINLSISTSLCDQIPSSVIQTAIGKDIVNTVPHTSSTTNVCEYYVDQTHFVTLRLNTLSYETQKQGQITLGRTATTNTRIHLDHFIAMQDDGLINDIVLKINDNLFIAIDRSSGSTFSEEMMLQLASDVADYLVTGINNTETTGTPVPTLDDEQFIRNFFGLIEDKRASDAVLIMSAKNTSDDSTKQAWGVQFNNFSSVTVVSITPQQQSAWTSTYHQYKVVLDVVMNPNSANEPIPYYGYENGQNTRWIGLVKEDGAWRIDAIATGP
jgi:hypothetical protein